VEEQQHFPWDEVNAARNNKDLQSQHPVGGTASTRFRAGSRCPKCKRPADQLSWFYFTSSPESWDSLAGRAGWMSVCDKCNNQVDFFMEIMS
jgi:bacterioferritin-associated ferredoxin